ncbi:hypothetical protein Tco_0104374 [Tanacetum coccineum]
MERCIYTYKWHVGLGLHGLIHGPLLTNYSIGNKDKNLSEIQLDPKRVDRLVVVVVKVVHEYKMVVKEIEDGLVEEMEKLEWWFEQDIDEEERRIKKMKIVVKYEN